MRYGRFWEKNFKLPMIMSNHRVECPKDSEFVAGTGTAVLSTQTRLDFSTGVFYYPRGHTEKRWDRPNWLPSSHLVRAKTPLHESTTAISEKGVKNSPHRRAQFFITHYSILAPRPPPLPVAASAICLKYKLLEDGPPPQRGLG